MLPMWSSPCPNSSINHDLDACTTQQRVGTAEPWTPSLRKALRDPRARSQTTRSVDSEVSYKRVSFAGGKAHNAENDVFPAGRRSSANILNTTVLDSLLPKTELPQEYFKNMLGPDDDDSLGQTPPAHRESQMLGHSPTLRHHNCHGWQLWQRLSKRPKLCPHRRFRMLDREGPFGQSKGHWAINNITTNSTVTQSIPTSVDHELQELFMGDCYHAFLDAGVRLQLGLFAIGYIVVFVTFALLYLAISEDCGLELDGSFVKAYLLSVETMVTIGYGVPRPCMKGCMTGTIALTMQCLLQLLMAACLIGVIFQRLSRPQARACTIIFTKRAVIREIDHVHYFMFRICDLRVNHTLIEPSVRCYCVRRCKRHGDEIVPMRLEHPDDAFGGSLILSLPVTVVHRIDAWSPLAPHSPVAQIHTAIPPDGCDLSPDDIKAALMQRRREKVHLQKAGWLGTLQRQPDCEIWSRDSCICHTCGQAFNTAATLQLHCAYNAEVDKLAGLLEGVRHESLSDDYKRKCCHEEPTRQDIEDHLSSGSHFEVVVLVEGIEPTTSSNLQARHSYNITQHSLGDVAWDMDFANCCRVREDRRCLEVDWMRFHLLESEQAVNLDDV